MVNNELLKNSNISRLPIHDVLKVNLYNYIGGNDLYKEQYDSILEGIYGNNIIVSFPTGMGKSLIAYTILLNKLYFSDKIGIYLVPLKALSTEKYDDLFTLSKGLGISVGIIEGNELDIGFNMYNILIMTYEKFDVILRNYRDFLNYVDIVVVDEIHYIGDKSRGVYLEDILNNLLFYDDIQIIGLSATINNIDDIVRYIRGKKIVMDIRKIPLNQIVYYSNKFYYYDTDGNFIKTKDIDNVDDIFGYIIDNSILNGDSVLVFVNSRKKTWLISKYIMDRYKRLYNYYTKNMVGSDKDIMFRDNEKIFDELSNNFYELVNKEGVYSSLSDRLMKLMKYGISFHNSSLSDVERKFIEDNFRSKKIKIIVSTSTLSAGINLPANVVIINDLKVFERDIMRSRYNDVIMIKQMSGRAGRPQYAESGNVYFICKSKKDFDHVIEYYIGNKYEDVYSSFNKYNVNKILLGDVSNGVIKNDRLFDKYIDISYYNLTKVKHNNYLPIYIRSIYGMDKYFYDYLNYYRDYYNVNFKKSLTYLINSNYVLHDKGLYISNKFGDLVNKLFIYPETGINFMKYLNMLDKYNIIDLLMIVLYNKELYDQLLYVNKSEMLKYMDRYNKMDLNIRDLFKFRGVSTLYMLMIFKTSLMLYDYINEVDYDTLFRDYDVGVGDIHIKSVGVSWLLFAFYNILRYFKDPSYIILEELELRVRYGVMSELLPLFKLKYMDRNTARILYDNGIKDYNDFINSDLNYLLSIEGINKYKIKKIYNYVFEKVDDKNLDEVLSNEKFINAVKVHDKEGKELIFKNMLERYKDMLKSIVEGK